MKLIITEAQYKALEQYIEEARQEKPPTSLKPLFDDNPEAKFFGVVQRIKNGGDSEYYFELIEENGHKGVKDVNKMGKTKNCVGDLLLDTVLYGNQFKMPFASCGIRTINNVTTIKLYASADDINNDHIMDSMEIEHELDTPSSELADKYYEMLKNAQVGQQIYIDSKNKWDGIITRKFPNQIQIELYKHGIPINEADADMEWNVQPQNTNTNKTKQKPKKKSSVLTIDLTTNPFYEENGTIMFKGVNHDAETGEKSDFIADIKKFDVSSSTGSEQREKITSDEPIDPQTTKSQEEIRAEAKKAYDMILKDPILKDAFYRKPSFWNLFVAEMNGKSAPGKGIFPVLQMLGSYGKERLNEKLGAKFTPGKLVIFGAYNRPYEIDYKDKKFQLSVGSNFTGVVRNYNIGDEHYTIDNKRHRYKIYVKDKTDVEHVYKCELIKYDINTKTNAIEEFEHEGDVYIKFKPSEGYTSSKPKNQTQPTP